MTFDLKVRAKAKGKQELNEFIIQSSNKDEFIIQSSKYFTKFKINRGLSGLEALYLGYEYLSEKQYQ